MKKRFSEEQIIKVLKEEDAGFSVKEIIRQRFFAALEEQPLTQDFITPSRWPRIERGCRRALLSPQ